MDKIKEKEIEKATKELTEALIECHNASITEEQAKLAKIKAHKRLLLAKDNLRNIYYEIQRNNY